MSFRLENGFHPSRAAVASPLAVQPEAKQPVQTKKMRLHIICTCDLGVNVGARATAEAAGLCDRVR